MTPEGKVKQDIKAYLLELGAYFFMPVPMGYGVRTVDILACVKGRFVAIECKRPHKQPTTKQALTLQAIQKAGGIAIWATSVETVKEVLRAAL